MYKHLKPCLAERQATVAPVSLSIRLRSFPGNRGPFSVLPSFVRVLFVSRCPMLSHHHSPSRLRTRMFHSPLQLTPPPLGHRAALSRRYILGPSSTPLRVLIPGACPWYTLFSSFSNSNPDPPSRDSMLLYLYPRLSYGLYSSVCRRKTGPYKSDEMMNSRETKISYRSEDDD